jgi:hypothetical protein
MKRLASHRQTPAKGRAQPRRIEEHPETQALLRNLDKVYAQLRKRARAEWQRSHSDTDPSDTCVSVRITCDNGEGFTVSATSGEKA